MTKFIVFFLLFIVAFIILPFGVTQFENPKVIISQFLIIILFLIHVFTGFSFLSIPNPYKLIYCLLIILLIVDLTFFQTPISFFGNSIRLQGTFLYILLPLFALLSMRVKLNKISKNAIFII